MKILFVVPHFPPNVGGVENYAFNIAQGLQQDYDCEVVVVTSQISGKRASIEREQGMKIYRLPILLKLSNTPINPFWYFSLKRIIQEEQPDLINSQQPVGFLGDIAALAAGEVPFILTYHSGTMRKQEFLIDILISLYEKFVLPQTARKARKIICTSRFVQDTLLQAYASKITIISPGVNTALYRPDPTLAREDAVILFTVRYKKMYRMKGLYNLIEAISKLEGVRLRVVGEIDTCENSRVEFVGVKRGPDLAREMQQASLLVLPSRAHVESFGMVLIEAMACRTPVIGTNIGGIPEVISDGVDGFLVPPDDSEALAQAMARILQDKTLAARMGACGEAKVKEKFTWETRVALTEEVFRSCIQ